MNKYKTVSTNVDPTTANESFGCIFSGRNCLLLLEPFKCDAQIKMFLWRPILNGISLHVNARARAHTHTHTHIYIKIPIYIHICWVSPVRTMYCSSESRRGSKQKQYIKKPKQSVGVLRWWSPDSSQESQLPRVTYDSHQKSSRFRKFYTLIYHHHHLFISTDIPDLFSPPLPIVHRFRQILRAITRIITELLLYVGSSWSP